MKIAIQTVISHGHVPAIDQIRAIEAAGFAGFYAGEHHHMPTSTPVPDFYRETGVPEFYKFCPDPFTILGAAAGAAPRLMLGTAILLAPIHDTIMLANRISTLDNLTGGRTMFALGVGWNKPELDNHGVEFDTRVDKAIEQVRALKALWGQETASFDGRFVRFSESWQGPKPAQKPHPPLLLGGRPLKRNFQFIAELLDGWMPTDTYAKTFGGDVGEQIARLKGMVAEAGRDPAGLRNVFEYAELFLYDRDPAQFAQDAPTRDDLARLDELGFEQVILGAPTFSEAHFHGAIDHLVRLGEPWLD